LRARNALAEIGGSDCIRLVMQRFPYWKGTAGIIRAAYKVVHRKLCRT
jgi:hypothetical protein